MKKKPRFFCDNCGSEVGRDEKNCPHCGRFFSSVRCPKCGHSGEESSFSTGCPACGYSAPAIGGQSAVANKNQKKIPAGPLKLWVYILTVSAFILVITLLLIRLLQ